MSKEEKFGIWFIVIVSFLFSAVAIWRAPDRGDIKKINSELENLDARAITNRQDALNRVGEQGDRIERLEERFDDFVKTDGYIEIEKSELGNYTSFTNDPRRKDWENLDCAGDWWFDEESHPFEYEQREKRCHKIAKELNFVYPSDL